MTKENQNFGQVIEALREGCEAYRLGDNKKIRYSNPATFRHADGTMTCISGNITAFVKDETTTICFPYIPLVDDIFSCDWIIDETNKGKDLIAENLKKSGLL